LSLREKFTFCMIHGETFSQNCDAMPPIQDEDKKIFAYLPDALGEYSHSERQRNFLKVNADSVVALIKESITRTGYVGLNYKHTIVELNAVSLIPHLLDLYNKTKKDRDILTVFNLLMRLNDYAKFMESASNKKMYEADESNYNAFINYNEANETLIIQRVSEFYQTVKK